MENLYIQNYGKKRIVCVIGWNENNALIEDIKTEERYILNWELFLKYHEILQDYDCDISKYKGPNLNIFR
jgi:hypothetical protein